MVGADALLEAVKTAGFEGFGGRVGG